jgi:hypothetical protein
MNSHDTILWQAPQSTAALVGLCTPHPPSFPAPTGYCHSGEPAATDKIALGELKYRSVL